MKISARHKKERSDFIERYGENTENGSGPLGYSWSWAVMLRWLVMCARQKERNRVAECLTPDSQSGKMGEAWTREPRLPQPGEQP